MDGLIYHAIMKNLLYCLILSASLAGCHKRGLAPNEPDNASLVVGNYKLTKANYMGKDIISTYNAWLAVSRIDPNTVKADYKFSSPISPYTETWTLKKIAKDTLELKTGIGTIRYQSGQIGPMSLADGTLYLTFQKED